MTPARIIRLMLITLCLAVFSGCSSFHTEVGHALPESHAPFVERATHVEEVVEELGPPHSVSALPDGFVFLYEYSLVKEFQWGISLNIIRMPYLKVIKADSKLSEAATVLTFDTQGLLRAQGEAAWNEKLGGGGALQLIISSMSLTDTTAFQRLPDPLLWGRGTLQRPPVTLNAAHDLRAGRSGVQQRIAPVFVGQATLEMTPPKPLKNARKRSRY